MYLRSLGLDNVKLLIDRAIYFVRADGSIRLWTVLLGDNGTCKTTILQTIALASSGDRLARKLVDDAEDYRRKLGVDRDTSIQATFQIKVPQGLERFFPIDYTDEQGSFYTAMSALIKPPGKHAFSGVDNFRLGVNNPNLNEIRDGRQPGFFIVGYGVGRRLPKRGEVAIPPDPVADRIKGLFDSHHKMLGIDFFDALKEKNLHVEYAEAIKKVLLARDTAGEPLFPWLENLELQGEEGVSKLTSLLESRRFILNFGGSENISLAPHQLSQGYQSTFAWIADMLGHAFLDQGAAVDPSEMRGIALLDEIDLHLHPTWQRRIVPILKTIFPQMQFIVTTHSPLVLTGFEADEIIKLELEGDRIAYKTFEQQPGMQSGSELMENYFDVPAAARPELLEDQRKLAALLAQPPTSRDHQQEIKDLEQKLAPYYQSASINNVVASDQIEAEVAKESPSSDNSSKDSTPE